MLSIYVYVEDLAVIEYAPAYTRIYNVIIIPSFSLPASLLLSYSYNYFSNRKRRYYKKRGGSY